jgi:DNA-binding NtrC family response regulator
LGQKIEDKMEKRATRLNGNKSVIGLPAAPFFLEIDGIMLTMRLPVNLPKLLLEIRNRYVAAALKSSNGNKTVAAQSLAMKRTTLVESLKKNPV